MPKRKDLKKVLIIGSGPIVIGQAAEFDFSGSQAALAAREEGLEVVLVNSNPATIQTDTEIADRTYVEPLTVETLAAILRKERPDGILSGMGGQTALNLCSELSETGILKELGVELLGTPLAAIEKSEDREKFRDAMLEIGEPVPKSGVAHTLEEARRVVATITGYPAIVRPAYTLGGTGGGIAFDEEELEEIVGRGLVYSRIKQVLIEESVLGWKEFEYEVMRDGDDNCIIVCNMENIDPMGIHTGESAVVAPAQTLSDADHQSLRSAAIKIIRALGIEGGCNVQFAVHPGRWEYRVIEVNPRVSRSSALASKATGYPIARVAAKIAIGLALHEIPNSVTAKTPASFEPTIDYVVTKLPRWPFDKFRTVDRRLGTQMKSTGEAMAIGRTIEESLLKAVRSLETDRFSLTGDEEWTNETLDRELRHPTDRRLFAVAYALANGWSVDRVREATAIDPFFLRKFQKILAAEGEVAAKKLDPEAIRRAKHLGFSDVHLARLAGTSELEVRRLRLKHRILPTYKMVDTCAAEFEAATPYFYSTYESGDDSTPAASNKRVLVVGGGPIRIGQGIEFDYCCVHAAKKLKELGYEAIMVNNNPETVSTDFDVSTRLYFEPLTLEDVFHVVLRERPQGVILQFGGQTSVNLALPLQEAIDDAGLPTRVLGTTPENMDVAEDREKFNKLMEKLHVPQPAGGWGHSFAEVKELAARIGYPVLVRPSYVLGGRGMVIVYDEGDLEEYMKEAARVSKQHPVLVDKYLDNAIEVDVDAVSDGEEVLIGGILEHVEEAGVHSGDATMVMPPQTLPSEVVQTIRTYSEKISLAMGIVGSVNYQYAVKDNRVYILEANPRGSRTVPFVAKATGVPLAKVATECMLGAKIRDLRLPPLEHAHVAVKASVFPFLKLPGVDSILGPEMKSTGEVMGIDKDFPRAFYKGMLAAGMRLPTEGAVFLTVRGDDKAQLLPLAQKLSDMGFRLYATKGTAAYLRDFGVPCETAWRISEERNPDAIDLMRSGEIKLVINTPSGARGARTDGSMMRRLAVELNIPFVTTMEAARAAVKAIEAAKTQALDAMSLQEYHARARADARPNPKTVLRTP
ncbi:MAG: carbamoyl-phosphate synthase large subunit [Methanobacteriota archaeon]